MSEKELNSPVNTKKVRLWFYISGAFFVFSVILTGSIYYFFNHTGNEKVLAENKEDAFAEASDAADLYPRLIDGVLVAEKNINPPILAVMIDNHVDARPPANIDKASLVYEAEAEGGITRYVAFFTADQDYEEIGPIRSARPYFIDWAKELKALYVHVGGSPAALVKLEKEKVFHVNEFFNGSYFWRDAVNFAPHNVFSSSELLKDYVNRNETERSKFRSWKFVDDKEFDARGETQEISIDYKNANYQVKWKYDKANNNYIRFLADKPHVTRGGEIVTAKNIAIISIESQAVDEKLRLEMDSIGNGTAQLCHEGECNEGVWEKTDSRSRTMLYNEDGQEMSFIRGNTWIEVVKPEYGVEIN